MPASVWDDDELKPPANEYVKLDKIGDKIGGRIHEVTKHRFSDDDVAPQIRFTDKVGGTDEQKVWTAGQLQAKRQLTELRPEPGEDFTAELIDVEKRGTKTLKHIVVEVYRDGTSAPWVTAAAAPNSAPAAAAAPAQPDMAAVLAQLSPDQRAALLAQSGQVNSSPGF